MEQLLSKIGFTHGETKVYLALLELGNVTSGPVVDKSGISKSKVYEILDRLTKKGVVSQIIEENVKHFQAVNPKKLIDLCSQKERELKSLKQNLSKEIPTLEQQFLSIKKKQEVTVFRDQSGLKSIFQNILNKLKNGDEYIVFCAVGPPKNFESFLEDWNNERISRKIKLKIIFNNNASKKFIEKSRKNKYSEVKTIFPEFNTPAVFNLYGDDTAILLWSKNPIGIVIENSEITNSFRKYFEILWNIAK